jgi:hypothetical protein
MDTKHPRGHPEESQRSHYVAEHLGANVKIAEGYDELRTQTENEGGLPPTRRACD